jgi:hypothetical protein
MANFLSFYLSERIAQENGEQEKKWYSRANLI